MITETEIYFPTDWRAIQILFPRCVKGCGRRQAGNMKRGSRKKPNHGNPKAFTWLFRMRSEGAAPGHAPCPANLVSSHQNVCSSRYLLRLLLPLLLFSGGNCGRLPRIIYLCICFELPTAAAGAGAAAQARAEVARNGGPAPHKSQSPARISQAEPPYQHPFHVGGFSICG